MKIVNKTGYLKGAKTAKNPVNIIPSNLITTQGMAFPIKANGKTLYPNTGQYKFPTSHVVETPLKKKGTNDLVPNKMSKTSLSKAQEIAYQRWMKSKGYNESDDYDMRDYWKNEGFKNLGSPKGGDHFPDTYKRLAPFSEGDNYPTLSDESNRASKFDKRGQGTWTEEGKYVNYQEGTEGLDAMEYAKFPNRIKDKKRRDTQIADIYNATLDHHRGDTINAKRKFKSFFTHYGSERFDNVKPLEGYYGFDKKDYEDSTLDSLGRNWHKKMKISKKQKGVEEAKANLKSKKINFNFTPNTSLSTDNTANIQGREIAKVDKFRVQKTKDYNAAQAAGAVTGDKGAEDKFYARYGEGSGKFKYDTDSKHKAQVNKKLKVAEKAKQPILREDVKLDPNAMFMLPTGLKGQAAKDYQDFHKEVIQSALPIPGLDKMSGLGKINKLESTLLPAAKKTSSTLDIASSIKNIPNYLNNTLNLTDEALGRLFRNKGNKEAISKGNQWLENWIKHPKTQAKIDADLDNALAARNKVFDREIALTRKQSKEYVPSVKEYPFEKQLDDLAKGKEHIHSGNIGVSYTHNTGPYLRDQIATGTYKPRERYGDWMSRRLSIPQKKRVGTSIHEGTHGWANDNTLQISGMRDRVLKEMPEDVKKNFLQWESLKNQHINPETVMGQTKAYEGYISDPTEMHARVMQIREHFNLTPDDVIDRKRAKNLIRRLEQIPYHRRPVDIDAMSKTIGNNPESFANLMNNMWAVPAVGAAGVAVQEKKEGGKNMKAAQYKNKYEKRREELRNKYDSLRRSRGFIDMLFGNDEENTRAMANLFDQSIKNNEEEISPITSGLKAARNSKRRQKAARLDLKKSNPEVGPTIENARKLKSQGAPDIFPTPNLGTQVASSINSFANDPKNKYKPKTLTQAKAEMRKMKPEQLKASGKANFTLGPLDAAAAASSGLVGGTIGLGGALLNTTIPGLGLTLGEGLGAYGGYDAIANRIPQTIKDYKNKKYGSAAENAIMGGLGLLGLGSNFKNFKLPKFTSSKKPSVSSNQLAPPPAEIELLPEGGSVSYATPVTPPPPPTVFNKSGVSKEAILSNPDIKNKDAISKLSNSEFEKTVLKPNGEVVEYEPALNLNLDYDRNLGKLALKDRVPMTMQEYTDEFNSRLDMLNDIIEKNNTSGTQYAVKGLDENGRLTFAGPTGESHFYVDVNPGLWKGDVKDIANTDYFRSIPGLGMRSTTHSVFGDGRARKGSKAYESINEYLKKLDMGRVKAGFNSQTSSSRPLWENAIKSGKAYGFYADPSTVHGVMRNLVPPLLIGGVGAGAMQEKKNGSKLLKYKNGSKSVSLAFSRGEKDPKGGLTQKGVDKYNRATGGNLKMAVTTPPSKLKAGSKDANRRKSFCARMSGVKGPMAKNGKPTRKALALRKWNC